jgi:hypothetical protein
MQRITFVAAFLVALTLAPSSIRVALADPEECRDAVDRYNSALDDVSSTLRRYASCVSSSRGHDDCSSEFRRLRNAQDDFESAVSEYESECN